MRIFKFLMAILVLSSCDVVQKKPDQASVDIHIPQNKRISSPEFVGSWFVISGMTPEDAEAGYMFIEFRKDGGYESSYVSPTWKSTQKGLWKGSETGRLTISNVSQTTTAKLYDKNQSDSVMADDYTMDWVRA